MENISQKKKYSIDVKSVIPYIVGLILSVTATVFISMPESSKLGTYLWAKYGTTNLPATVVFNFAYTFHYSIWLYALTLAGVLSGGTAVVLGILLSL